MPRGKLKQQLFWLFIIIALALVGVWRRQLDLPRNDRLKLEYAVTAGEQARGLSGRDNLDENSGMLFIYQQDNIPSFWMKEMRFPIDIVWLDKNWEIIGIEKNIAPETYPQTFSPPQPVRYVLEINAGKSAQLGWEIGDKAL